MVVRALLVALLMSGCGGPEGERTTGAAHADATPPLALPPDHSDAIAAFWQWWAEHRSDFEGDMSGGLDPALIEAISEKVDAIHPELAWEIGPGFDAKRALVVCAGGVSAQRTVAARWRAAAPPPDGDWEYHDTKPPVKGSPTGFELQVGPHEVAGGDVRVGIEEDEERAKLDVFVAHPAFGSLPQDVKLQIAFMMLDQAIGEASVARWIGEVDAGKAAPADALTLDQLRGRVTSWALEPREPAFALGRLSDARTGADYLILMDQRANRWSHALFDTLVRVTLSIEDPQDNGMPQAEEKDALDAAEEALNEALGERAKWHSHVIGQGVYVINLYTDGLGPVPDEVKAWAAALDREATVRTQHDPSWDADPI